MTTAFTATIVRAEARPFCELTKVEKAECKAAIAAGEVAKVKFERMWWVVAQGHPLFPVPVTDDQGLTAEEIEAGEMWAEECDIAWRKATTGMDA